MAGTRSELSHAGQSAKWVSFAVALAGPLSVWASPSAELSRAARRLGSSQFAERHEAGDLLLKAGPSAIPFLREAAGSGLPEVRFRAQGILERIELQILDAQKAEILSGSMQRGQFPAWDRYLEIVDDSPPARQLFVAMLDRSPQLLLSLGTPESAEVFDRKLSDWATSSSPWQRRTTTPDGIEELTALLLAACQPESTPTPFQVQLLSRSAEFSWFQHQAQNTERKVALRSILSAWITQTGRQPADSRLHLAMQYRFPEGTVPAREIIDSGANGLEIQNAMMFLSMYGDDEDVPRLEKLLDNDTLLQNFQTAQGSQSMKTQIRDVALAALWRLRKQDPAQHGLKDYREQNGVPRAGTIGFRDDEERRSAIDHWRAWRKRAVKADLPPDGWAVEGRRG
jgi:hypothetical protein